MKPSQNFSFINANFNPPKQALAALVLALGLIILSRIVAAFNIIEVDQSFPWMTTCAFLLLFAVVNSRILPYGKKLDNLLAKFHLQFPSIGFYQQLNGWINKWNSICKGRRLSPDYYGFVYWLFGNALYCGLNAQNS